MVLLNQAAVIDEQVAMGTVTVAIDVLGCSDVVHQML